ncbi:hypothetical protein MY04_0648 [Flammeovirga sp. MY04]|uniref:hypothetical protein n=1 Tax=Flammeovirga sp. MY04 TaxID=1191459 RepID=UPI0008061AF6|nr:hypothetical protein [Flammeovirga sp. MY04]ANQ48030.1 hypothetical protein MY04_0648 [Flammeovirga sp. MY04]
MKTTLLFLFTFFPLFIFSQGKIDQVRKNIKKQDTKTYSKSSSSSTSHSSNSNSNNNFSVLGTLVMGIVDAIPSERELTQMYGAPLRLQKYPYYMEGGGKFSRYPEAKTSFTTEFEMNYVTEMQNLQSGNMKLRLNFAPKFSISGKGNYYQEKINENTYDHMGTLHLNASYHLLAYTGIDAWIGIGYSHLFLDDGYSGVNMNLGTELYLFKPVGLYTEWYFSGLSDDVDMREGTIGLKWYMKSFYVQGGYNSLRIVGVDFSGVMFGVGVVM